MKTYVWIKTSFEGFHQWTNAPDCVAFLRDFHRHIFNVKLGKQVTHENREIEFFQLKATVDRHLDDFYAGQYFVYSCENIAAELLKRFDADFVEVDEDGENGARVEK
jgi:hypothetical protein